MNFIFPINPQPISANQIMEMNTLVLAYVGDSVHATCVRASLASQSFAKADALNKLATKLVNAKAQAACMQAMLPMLNDNEKDIFNRTRNSHVNSVAKTASLAEYKAATCFEAVLGYLYLSGQSQRATQLLNATSAD